MVKASVYHTEHLLSLAVCWKAQWFKPEAQLFHHQFFFYIWEMIYVSREPQLQWSLANIHADICTFIELFIQQIMLMPFMYQTLSYGLKDE